MTNLDVLARARRYGRTGQGRRIREAAGITLREMARVMNVDATLLSKWERGLVVPRERHAVAWDKHVRQLERYA